MKPFEISPALACITGTYPDFNSVKALFEDAVQHQNFMFIRLWLAEGIPYAFKECPSIYQISREWLAKRLGVESHQISIVGSGRLGYSLNPKNLERSFYEKSDLDYVVISDSLFNKCADASLQFVTDFESGKIIASSRGEIKWWPQDVEYIKRNTPKGFISHGKVPNLSRYEATRYLEDQFSLLSLILRGTEGCPNFTKASFRLYKSHDSFVRRAAINIDYVLSQA